VQEAPFPEPSPEAPEGMKKGCEMASPRDDLAAATAELVQKKTAASPMTTSTQATAASQKAPGQSDVDQKTESEDVRPSLQKKEEGQGATLRAAKKAGRRMRWRITGTCLTIGPPFILASVPLNVLDELMGSYKRTGAACTSCAILLGLLVLMLGILPTDRRAIRGLGVFCCFLATLIGTVTLVLDIPSLFEESRIEYCTDCPSACWTRIVHVSLVAVNGIALVLGGAVVAHGICRLHARELLDRVWLVMARIVLTVGTTSALMSMLLKPYQIATCASLSDLGSADVLEEKYITGGLIYSFGFAILGFLTSRRSFRSKAQSWLASRGGGVKVAAAIAAMIGKNDIDKVLETAAGKFRYMKS